MPSPSEDLDHHTLQWTKTQTTENQKNCRSLTRQKPVTEEPREGTEHRGGKTEVKVMQIASQGAWTSRDQGRPLGAGEKEETSTTLEDIFNPVCKGRGKTTNHNSKEESCTQTSLFRQP